VEVWSGQQLGISLLEPFEASLPLALGTMAVATGAVMGVRVLAVVTKLDDTAQRFWIDVDTSANGIGQRATIANIRYVSDAGLQMTSTRALLCFDARGIASTAGSCESGDAKVIFSDGVVADTVSTTILGKVLR